MLKTITGLRPVQYWSIEVAKKIIPPKTGLTDSFLKSIKPQKKRYEVADPKTPGLRIRVNPTGKINFIWYYRPQGKKSNKVLTLGSYGGEMTLKQARAAIQTAKNKHLSYDYALYTGETIGVCVNISNKKALRLFLFLVVCLLQTR